MRKKIFITPKAIKVSLGIFAGVLVVAGSISLFYLVNQTIPYAQSLDRNKRLAVKNGVMPLEAVYWKEVKAPARLEKRIILRSAYLAAATNNLIGKSEISEEQMRKFLSDFDGLSTRTQPENSVIEQDRYAKELEPLLNVILSKSDELGFLKAPEFELKKQVLSHLSTIATSMDGQGSFEGNIARAGVSVSILRNLHEFQTKQPASMALKDQLIDATLPILSKPTDIKFMFRFEHLRIQKMIDVSRGIAKIDPKSEIYVQPKPFNFVQRFKLSIPGVASACESRFNAAVAKALITVEEMRLVKGSNDEVVLSMLTNDRLLNRVNTEYMANFGYDASVRSKTFQDKEWYLFKIRDYVRKSKERKGLVTTK